MIRIQTEISSGVIVECSRPEPMAGSPSQCADRQVQVEESTEHQHMYDEKTDQNQVYLRKTLERLWAGQMPDQIEKSLCSTLSELDLRRSAEQLSFDLQWRSVLSFLDTRLAAQGTRLPELIEAEHLSEVILPTLPQSKPMAQLSQLFCRCLDWIRFDLLASVETQTKNKTVSQMHAGVRARLKYGVQHGLSQDKVGHIQAEDLTFLSKSNGIAVRLSGLRVIDFPSAFQLSHFQGYGIFLDGLVYIEPEVLEVLSRFRGVLSLNGLVWLSEDSARAMACHTGSLHLKGLQYLSFKSIEVLAMGDACRLVFGAGFCESEMNMIALSPFLGTLDIELQALTDTMAASLSGLKARSLTIRGLQSMTKSQALRLAEYKGHELRLPDLGHLDERIVQALSKFSGQIVNLRGP